MLRMLRGPVQSIAKVPYLGILKFDEAKHPRDKEGQFTSSQGVLLDKTGQPLKVYHGSVDAGVKTMELDPNRTPVRLRSGPNGIYFTSDAASAFNYVRRPGAGIKGPRGRVVSAHLTMHHPLDITDAIKKGRKQGLSFGDAKRKALEALTKEHDGVIFRGDDYNPDEYIVFSNAQIHSLKWDSVEKQEHDYGNTQISLDPWSSAYQSLNLARDLIRNEDCMGTGKDVDPNHVTVRFGLLNDDLDGLRSFIASQYPFEAQVIGIELFPASEHSDGAVPVVARIQSPELHAIEQEIGQYADFKEKNFPEYKPHCTLAYVIPAAATQYADLFVGGTFLVHAITISHASGVKETIPFGMAQKWDEDKHPRDKEGQFTTLYHGTREQDVESIRREGLRPGAAGLVWATESREDAQRFAEGLDYPQPTVGPTVIEIQAPKSAFFFEKPLTPGRKAVIGKRVARFSKAIPPEWVKKRQPKLWDASRHPRNPAGSGDKSGEFTEVLSGPRDAVESLLNGEKASIDPGDVRRMLEIASELPEGVEPNLLNLHIDGFEVFDQVSLGIERKEMPQIPREHRANFIKEMKAAGVKITTEWVDPMSLAPTQNEISARNAGLKLHKYETKDKEFPPLLVSQEGRVLDGHHHWGMMVAYALDDPKAKIPIYRLNVSVRKALALAYGYARKYGLEQESLSGAKVAAKKWDETQHPRDKEGQFRAAFVKEAIQSGQPHKVTEDEFLAYHKTGDIESDAYEKFEAGDLDFIHRKEFVTLLGTREINGQTVEIRLAAEPTKYYKRTVALPEAERDRLYEEFEQEAKRLGTTTMMATIDLGYGSEAYNALKVFEKRWLDSGEDVVRDAQGNLVYLTTEEMQAQGLPTVAYTVGAFVGDKAIGYAGDEFGASGVYLARSYQRHGLGLELIKTYLEKSGRLAKGKKTGQMTFAGQKLMRALHRQLVKEAAAKKWDESQHPRDEEGQFAAKPVAITENLAKHAGMEMVAVKDLVKFQTQDRRIEPKGAMNITEPTETLLPRLTQELREGGAIKEPLELAYDTSSGRMLLIDGNTRLAAIVDAGFTHAPVIISRQDLHGFGAPVRKLSHAEAGIDPYRNWLLPSEAGFHTLSKVKKADPASGRYVTPFVSFDKQGDDLLRMIASLNSSRLATWGFTAEAEVRGLARYKITAVLDGRTSKFCRFIDGRIFEVPDAREKVIEALNVQDPNDLRVVQPWPKQTKEAMAEFAQMSDEDLVSRGLHIPPYHPFCRTLLKPVQSSAGELTEDETTPTVPDDVETFQLVTMADLKELGIDATQEQVDDWNAHIGMSPVELLSKLTGVEPREVMTDGVGSKAIQFGETGNIGFNTRGEVSGVEFKVGALLDPFTGIYYLTHADLVAGTPKAEAAFLKKMFTALMDMGQASPTATAIAAAVAGNAAYYAKLGFLPDEIEWDTLRHFALDELETGLLQPVMASLSPADQELVRHLLKDRSVSAISTLVDLPFTYEGKTIGEWILQETGGTWAMDLTDAAIVDQAKAYLL